MINEDQVLANLYHLAMNHDNICHSHDILTISPNSSLSKKGKKTIRYQLKDLEVRGFTSKDYFDKWFITDEGINRVENYFQQKEEI